MIIFLDISTVTSVRYHSSIPCTLDLTVKPSTLTVTATISSQQTWSATLPRCRTYGVAPAQTNLIQ